MTDQAQTLRQLAAASTHSASLRNSANVRSSPCRSIAVVSGKGGVGKTNIAISLSIGLAALKKKTMLFDADLGLANIHIMLGTAPKRNISHVLKGECSFADVIMEGPAGVSIVPAASGLSDLADLSNANLAMLRQSLAQTENGYDFLVFDTAAGIGSGTISFAANADVSVLVVTPEPTSFADAYAAAKVLFEKGARKIVTIVNMAPSDEIGRETFDKLNTLVVKFLKRELELIGILPNCKEVPDSVRVQQSIMMLHSRSVFVTRIHACARTICGISPKEQGGFFARLFGRK